MNNKKDANKRERELANTHGFKKSCNSGAVFRDGDCYDDLFMVDEKFTVKNSISIKLSDLIKIDTQAFSMHPARIPVMVLNINGDRRAIISMEDFDEYRKLLLDKSG